MTEHFTRSTVSSAFYCSKCGKVTQHRIDDGRKGPCLGCIARLDRQHAESVEAEVKKQMDLFAKPGDGTSGMSRLMNIIPVKEAEGKTIKQLDIAVCRESSNDVDALEIRFTDGSIWTLAIRRQAPVLSHHFDESVEADWDGSDTVVERPTD
jgi:hypothetical protein